MGQYNRVYRAGQPKGSSGVAYCGLTDGSSDSTVLPIWLRNLQVLGGASKHIVVQFPNCSGNACFCDVVIDKSDGSSALTEALQNMLAA